MRHSLRRGVSCAIHSHRGIEIIYHPTGRGVARPENEAEVPFREGDVVVHPARQRHDQVMTAPGEDFCVQIALPPGLKSAPGPCLYVPGIEDPSLLQDLRTLSQGRVKVGAATQTILDLRATSVLCALIQHATMTHSHNESDGIERHVSEADRFIREHFARIRSLREVAANSGISYDHLRHLFKARRGRSLVRYLNEMRMERAKLLLVHSRLPLKQVATMCGFHDEYYFSAVFRRFFRTPPGKYRTRQQSLS